MRNNTQLTLDAKFAGCSLQPSSGNIHNGAFSVHGSHEYFDGGGLDDGAVMQSPRWFRFGPSTCCELATQIAIVAEAEAIGDDTVTIDDATRQRRIANFKSWYTRVDVPLIAYKYCHHLQHIYF